METYVKAQTLFFEHIKNFLKTYEKHMLQFVLCVVCDYTKYVI